MELDDFEKDLKAGFKELKAFEQNQMPSFDDLLHRPIPKKKGGLIRPLLLKVGLAGSLLLGTLTLANWDYFSVTPELESEIAIKDWTISNWQASSHVLLEQQAIKTSPSVSSISNWQAPSSALMPQSKPLDY